MGAEGGWRGSNFLLVEIACCGTGKLIMHEAGFDGCRYCGKLLAIARPDYRSPEHNRATGGATRSKHMEGTALRYHVEPRSSCVRGGGA